MLRAVTRPFEPGALSTIATARSDEPQVTAVVRSWVELSVYVPVAVSCFCVPFGMVGAGGVIAMDTSVAAVTVSVVDPEMVSTRAVMVDDPVPGELARPFVIALLLTVATDVVD